MKLSISCQYEISPTQYFSFSSCLIFLMLLYNFQQETHLLPSNMLSMTSIRQSQIVNKVVRVLSRSPESKRQEKKHMLDLPTELLLKIFSYLPLPNQVSLTLSSKGLYQLFNHVLRSKELRFPRMPQKNGRAYWTTDEHTQRMSLLLLLQNKTWACCARCQILHRRSEFPWPQLRNHYAWERACTPYAGIVDLCPCISLTLRARARIVEYLKATKKNTRCTSHQEPGKEHLVHKCTAYRHFRIEMQLELTGSGQLIACTQYTAPNFDPPGRKLDAELPLCCSKVWTDALKARTMHPWSCDKCDARIVNLMPSHERVVIINVTRFLGRGTWFDACKDCFGKQWYSQCRSLSDYIFT